MALSFATQTSSIKTIYLAGYWSYLASGAFEISKDNYRIPRSLSEVDIPSFLANGNTLLEALSNSGKNVVFMMDIPDLDFNIKSCFDSRPLRITHKIVATNCMIKRSNFDRRRELISKVLFEITSNYPSISIYDPLHLFCDDENCRATYDGKPLYYDSDHLSERGADMVINDLLTVIPID